jgi:serine/threonine-protein phosphatase 2B catalytic subunit
MTSFFNFKQECEVKYDAEVYDIIMETFDCLPLACLINEKFIAIHGGISPEINKIADITKINRFEEPPKSGAMCDMLWSDPCEKDDEAIGMGFITNSTRGCSYVFGNKAATPFLQKNDILSIIRAHEAQLEGFKMYKWDQNVDFPSVITIFSAPNYCDVYNNKAAVIKFKNNMVNIQQYNYSPHPFILPNFMNIFNWSIPFVSEKISEMLLHIIKKDPSMDEGNDTSRALDENISNSLRMKVKFITMLMKMFRTLREESELIMKLKGFCPGNKIPRGILIQGPEALKTALERYKNAKTLDSVNERMPKNYK